MTTENKMLTIEVLSAPHCPRCKKTYDLIQSIIHKQAFKNITLSKLNIVKELDYAVSLGLKTSPGIVINGQLLPQTPLNEKALLSAISKSLKSQT